MNVWKLIMEKLQVGSKVHVTVIDPADQGSDQAAEIAVEASKLGTDVLFVGGSTGVTSENLEATVLAIKDRCGLPVVFFARSQALSVHCDAILFLSILNSRNLRYVIGEHVAAAPYIHKLGFETISTGYVIVEPGMTVGKAAEANLLPREGVAEAVAYGLTAQFFGMDLLFLEAGSGASEPVSPAMVRGVKENVKIPLLVSGGIDTPEKAASLSRAGADIIGTGTVAENRDFGRLEAIIRSFKNP